MNIPPPLPPGSVYTRCWCEENVYLLCKSMLQDKGITDAWDVYAIFISNPNKTVALWSQKAARARGNAVIWDYHVILLLRPRRQDEGSLNSPLSESRSWVYDFDSTLPIPCPWAEYLDSTFFQGITPGYESQFRVVPGPSFLDNFACDRSHMLVKSKGIIRPKCSKTAEAVAEGPVYRSPPPDYPPICGAAALRNRVSNNLMSHFVSMSAEDNEEYRDSWGQVLDRNQMNSFFKIE